MFLFKKEMFESQADMLEYALKNQTVTNREVFHELEDIKPEDIVQIVMDYSDMAYICESLLTYERKESGS